jgi:hypothetical protein
MKSIKIDLKKNHNKKKKEKKIKKRENKTLWITIIIYNMLGEQ